MRVRSLLGCFLYFFCYGEAVTVHSRLGDLEGQELTTPNGKAYYSFTGIPYAKPPVGSLRLKNPVPHGSWSGKLDATKEAPLCAQIMIFIPALRNQSMGQEDCLYLNIYTPNIDSSKKLPVLIYVHGGGFRCGSPGPPEAPTNFMDEDAVLVTIHYRLGVLGFLSTEDSEIPGNFGLKDQALAIKWVHENIDQFGGDPSSIVVFGESAGGSSAHYLITSPLSRDYLKGAIAESGVVDAEWSLAPPGRGRRYADRVGESIGCNTQNNFLSCLQKIDAHELITITDKIFTVWDFDPAIVFQPIIEVENEGAFITEDPRTIEVKKPLITGIVSGEGLLKTAGLINQDDSVLEDFIENIDEYLPASLFIEPNEPSLAKIIPVIKSRYFKDLSNRDEVFESLELLYRDYQFVYPLHLTLERHSGPKYSYVFRHRAENSLADLVGPNKLDREEPSHGDELLSLFNWSSQFSGTEGREEDKEVSKKLVKMWINFAKFGNPTPKGSSVEWEEFEHGNVLYITTHEDRMGALTLEEVIDFWTEVFTIINPRRDKTEL